MAGAAAGGASLSEAGEVILGPVSCAGAHRKPCSPTDMGTGVSLRAANDSRGLYTYLYRELVDAFEAIELSFVAVLDELLLMGAELDGTTVLVELFLVNFEVLAESRLAALSPALLVDSLP